MSEATFLSRFSPQRTDPEALERIHVQREGILAEGVEKVRESIQTDNKHHLLFVGPRGAGKTHLLTLIHHRLQMGGSIEKARFAWLNEDEIATSFLKLLRLIYLSLSARYPDEFPSSTVSNLAGKQPLDAEEILGEALLKDLVQGGTIVLMAENLDELFRLLGEKELLRWRSFIQNHPVFATVGTAQALFPGISDHQEPFYGFFDPTHLEPLSVSESRSLLENIAELQGKSELLEFIRTPTGRARISAIHDLAGGNPRLYLVFSEFLNRANLDDLVRPFEEMVDRQLTSYYQERLRWLSAQQREIVQLLCHHRRPIPVKQIAEGLFTTHNSITGQLKTLRDMRYVHSRPSGREVLYELAEPLMRLALQVKETDDRKPLALIVDFLRVWHDRDEVAQHLEQFSPESRGHEYYREALELMDSGESNLRHEIIRQSLDEIVPERCDDETLSNAKCLAEETDSPKDWLKLGKFYYGRRMWEDAVVAFTRSGNQSSDAEIGIAKALIYRGLSHEQAGRIDEAIADYTRVIELSGAPSEQVAKALYNRGVAHGQAGRSDDAIADYTQVIELSDAPIEQVALALYNRSLVYTEQGQHHELLNDLNQMFSISIGSDFRQELNSRMSGLATRVVTAIFSFTTEAPMWSEQITKFVDYFSHWDALSQLGDALVRHLPKLAGSPLNHKAFDEWHRVWAEAASHLETNQRDQLEIPLRLLSVGIDYSKSEKESVLLTLPREERNVLREVFKLPAEEAK